MVENAGSGYRVVGTGYRVAGYVNERFRICLFFLISFFLINYYESDS